MQLHSLYLAPKSPAERPALDTVADTLRVLEVIGAGIGEQTYRVGSGFSQHVVFAGCSVQLVTDPPAGGGPEFSHLVLHGPFQTPLLVTAATQVRPRCPRCRHRVDRVAIPLEAQATWTCPACSFVSAACELDWRHYGLCGRVLIEVVNVFPGEASPSDTLMRAIEDATSVAWRHAWALHRGRPESGILSGQATTT